MLQMYKGAINSPETIITNNISNTDTLIYVQDETKVPTDLPNLMVLGTGISAETIKVLSISGLAITVERAFQGTAKTWNAGTTIARNFTEYDYEALKSNVEELTENQGDLTLLETVEQSNLVGAINENTAQLAQIESEFNSHIGSAFVFVTGFSRDMTIAGEQVINLLSDKLPKSVEIFGAVNDTKISSVGFTSSLSQRSLNTDNLGTVRISNVNGVRFLVNGLTDALLGILTLQQGGIKINWTKSGSPTGTANIIVSATYHD